MEENSSETTKSHIPSFFQNSCQGITAIQTLSSGDSTINTDDDLQRPNSSSGMPGVRSVGEERHAEEDEHAIIEKSILAKEGWTRSLTLLPSFDSEKLTNKLVKNASTMPDSGAAPKAYRNKKHGYRLWKEGYVRGVLVNFLSSSVLRRYEMSGPL